MIKGDTRSVDYGSPEVGSLCLCAYEEFPKLAGSHFGTAKY